MAKKFDLSSIISGKMDSMDVSKLDTKAEVREIPVDALLNNGENDIFTMLDEDMESLMESIRLNGVLEPPLVTPSGGKYRIVSGHRRTECVRRLHRENPDDTRWQSVLCVVQSFSEPEFETLALIQANTEARSNRNGDIVVIAWWGESTWEVVVETWEEESFAENWKRGKFVLWSVLCKTIN